MGIEIRKCTIISGAPDKDIAFLKENIDADSFIICADSGYMHCFNAGVNPNLIIGDFDSSKAPDIDVDVVKLPVEKAYTDTFTCVRKAIELGYNDITIFCAIGSRVDHTYSNILCLKYCMDNNAKCRICNRNNRISLISGTGTIPKEFANFSLFAYLEDCKGVKISGAYYTAGFYYLDALDINLGDQFAQSNYVTDDFATISLDSGTLLVIESND